MISWNKNKIIDFCYVTDFVANGSFASLRKNVKYIKHPDYAVLIRLTDFTKKWSKDFVYVSKPSYEFLKKSSLLPGDLIMSNVGEPGIVFLVPDLKLPMTLGPNSILIRPDEKKSSAKFLYFHFLSEKGKKQIDFISTGAAQKKFNKTSFRGLEVFLPPLLEQQRIVNILDKSFAAIDKAKGNAEKNLKNAKELFYTYLQNVFEGRSNNWNEKQFESCLEKVVYTNKIQRKDFLDSGKYPIVSQEKEFINGYWNSSGDLFKIKKPVVIFGDHTQVLKYVDFNFVLGADGVKILQVNNEIEPKYFYYYLRSVNLGNLGYARHYKLLKEIKICYPKSLVSQQVIVKKIDIFLAKTKKLEVIYKQKINNLEELKKSILQKAFNGEL